MMSRSTRHKAKYRLSSEISRDHWHEGTAARTRPFSFDEIMSKRKNKNLSENEKEGALEGVSERGNGEKVHDHYGSERGNGRNRNSSPGVQQRFSVVGAKASSRKKEEKTSTKDDYLVQGNDREIRDLDAKEKPKMFKDFRTEGKGKSEEKIHGKTKIDERFSHYSENEGAKKHSRDLVQKDRHMDGSRRKSERESKRKDRNGVDEKNRDMNAAKKHDHGKGHDFKTSERQDRKELSKSHHEELKLQRRRSRSRDHDDRSRRSSSLSPRAQKYASYHGRAYGELSSHSVKERSGRQHSDINKSKIMNNGSGTHYRRHGGSSSGLGGYSPRKRRSEAAVKTPSPAKQSPEKKSAKWDLAPEGVNSSVSASVSSNFQLSSKIPSLNIHEVISSIPVGSSTVKPLFSVSPSVLPTNKNVSIDSIQLTQATRPMRRLYVENVPPSASEKAVMECLNKFLISSGVNHIQGTQPCISCIIHKEKSQALVEFLTPEDASAALSFDGISFSGSIIKIRRPKDFVEMATGEPEKSMSGAEAVSDIVKDSPHKIFIGGISKALSPKMLMEIASAFGPLKAYQFESSKDLRELCAFLEYADQSVTSKACAGLNGMKLGGQVITAVQAVPNASLLESSGNPPFCGIPEHAKPLLEKPTQVLKIKNLFNPEALPSLSHTEIEEVLEDVRLECLRFGTVKSVNFIKDGVNPVSTSEACVVHDDMASARAQQNLGCDETNGQTETLKEDIEHKILKGCMITYHKPADDLIKVEPCQQGQFDGDDGDLGFQVQACPQELPEQCYSKDELDCNDDKVADKTELKDVGVENRLTGREEWNLEEVGGELKEGFIDGADAIQKRCSKEQDSNLGDIFEPGCVFVEFRRTEAACMAAHSLHGRSFDDRAVIVGYVPLDMYRDRFS